MFLKLESRIIKSFNLTIYFDDDTQKEVTITEGDKIYIEFLEDGALYNLEGILKSIHTILDDSNEICLCIDGSSDGHCLVKHVRESSIRDLNIIQQYDDSHIVKAMYGASALVSVAMNYGNGEDYELEDDEELKLFIRDKRTYETLVELKSPDKNNFIVPAEEILKMGVGEFLYCVLIEHENYSSVIIPYSKFIVWR